jgi:ribosome-binding ATPase YchF (GTP1/OBG family)
VQDGIVERMYITGENSLTQQSRVRCVLGLQVQDTIVERMYEQTQDSQESDVNALLDEIAEQHIKETMLAYYTLLALGRCLEASIAPMVSWDIRGGKWISRDAVNMTWSSAIRTDECGA